jgi:hypothetical protein
MNGQVGMVFLLASFHLKTGNGSFVAGIHLKLEIVNENV